MRMGMRDGFFTGSRHFMLIILSFIALFPFYWMVITSLRPETDVYSSKLWPAALTFENYIVSWQTIPMLSMIGNSFKMAVALMVLQLLTSILAAYAFTRWEFPLKSLLFGIFALTWLVPFPVTMIPNYVTISGLGWRNTLWGLVVPSIGSAFAVLMLFQAFKSFPKALVEAARLDGASSWATLWLIIFPNIRSTVAALGVLLFISSWNEYFWPLLVTNRMETTTLQIGLQMFISTDAQSWGPLMAAATISSLPVLLVYLFMQKQIIESFVKGGIK